MPELQKAISLKAWIDARKLHTIGVMVSGLVGLCAAAGLATFGNWIYSYWTAGELSVPFLVWPILGVGIMLNSLWWTSGLVHRATNQPWGMNLMGVVGALLTLGIMKVLGKAGLGISGFAFGAVVFEIIMASYVLRRSLEIMSDRPADFFIRMYQSLNEFTLFSKRATKNKLNVHINQ
jgi:O-antigen/teichoic acid export membrane protein